MKIMQKMAARTENAGGHRPVVIAFLGDSVTHGCFEVCIDHKGEISIVYEPGNGYPHRLKRRLDALYPAAAVSVINAGASGEGARDGAGRIERDVLAFKPDLVVVAFALNDSMNPDVETGLREYRLAMSEMLDKALAAGAECILLTPNFMCGYVPAALKGEELIAIARRAAEVQAGGVLARYVQAAREIAAARGVPVADAHRIWTQMSKNGVDTTRLLSNHINHPTRDAHDIFVEEILRVMLAPETC